MPERGQQACNEFGERIWRQDNVRRAIHLIVFGLLLIGCNDRESSFRNRLVGTWAYRNKNYKKYSVVTFFSDGRVNSKWTLVSSNDTKEWSYQGTWKVRDGILIFTVTNGSAKNSTNLAAIGTVERYNIIKLDRDQLVIVDGQQTNVFDRK